MRAEAIALRIRTSFPLLALAAAVYGQKAFWPRDKDNPPRIILTATTHLVTLNANTGRIDPGFGKEGIVDIAVPWNGVPAIFKNVVMLGATVGEVPLGPPGDSRAYDERTGAKLWEFHSVPRPGEKGFGSYGSGNDSPQLYDRGSVDGPGPYHGFSAQVKDANGKTLGTWPCQKPPWGRLVAVNANTGEIAWQTRLGITEVLPEGKQYTGNSGSAGPIVTAGGLVFIGATNDSRFRAFDAKNGKELWVTKLARNANANPITYQGKNGKQYVAVIAADSVAVFALP